MHSVIIKVHGDQEFEFKGKTINIHQIAALVLDGNRINDIVFKTCANCSLNNNNIICDICLAYDEWKARR
jgi:hypothetical protein